MEENFIGYVLGSLDPETHRRVETYLDESPVAKHHIELLRRAIGPLAIDRDTIDPPNELVLRTLSHVAEHIVSTEGSVAVEEGGSSVTDFIRSLVGEPPTKPEMPAYPVKASEATPQSWSPRNVIVSGGLTIALLVIGVTAVMSIRQTRDVQACQNNLRAMHQGISTYCDNNYDRCPQVPPNTDVREVLKKLNDEQLLARSVTFSCPGTGNHLGRTEVNGQTFIPSAAAIEYAYCMGYREAGQLNGLVRGHENEFFPILADAPDRHGDHAFPVNHRKGQNVLFLGGHVRFCTTANVGPLAADGIGDDIYYNTLNEAKAGTHRWDSVLGRANEKP
jgi:prepilin-type processing-associated H-X9-DG protein